MSGRAALRGDACPCGATRAGRAASRREHAGVDQERAPADAEAATSLPGHSSRPTRVPIDGGQRSPSLLCSLSLASSCAVATSGYYY